MNGVKGMQINLLLKRSNIHGVTLLDECIFLSSISATTLAEEELII